MNSNRRRLSASALAVVVCLAVTPRASAEGFLGGITGPGERIVRVIKKIRSIFTFRAEDDFPEPPRP